VIILFEVMIKLLYEIIYTWCMLKPHWKEARFAVYAARVSNSDT